MKYLQIDFKAKKVLVSSKESMAGYTNVGYFNGQNISFVPDAQFSSFSSSSITSEKADALIAKFMNYWESIMRYKETFQMADALDYKGSEDQYKKYVQSNKFSKMYDTLNYRTLSDDVVDLMFDKLKPTLKQSGLAVLNPILQNLLNTSFKNEKVTSENVQALLQQAFAKMLGSIGESKASKLRKIIREEIRNIKRK